MTISLAFLDDADGLNMTGRQRIQVQAQPAPTRFEIFVDDVKQPGVMTTNPFVWNWDTSKFSDGTHLIRAEAVYKTRRSKTQAAVSVKNSTPATSGYGSGAYGEGAYGG